jgi:solute carrier family 25 (mitochondrial oxoglutarate transporter), member 11
VFHDPEDKPASTQTQLGASLIAGFTATACSLPFDLLKSRMRKCLNDGCHCFRTPYFNYRIIHITSFIFCTVSEDGGRYKGIGDAVMKIYVNEGILSFWTGFGAYYMRTAPHAMIILMTTQPITDYYKKTFKL